MTSVELKVEESKISRGGRTRICPKAFEELEADTGKEIVVSSGDKDILLVAFTDDLVEEGVIYLRKKDMTRLNVNPGDTVSVSSYRSVSEKLKEKLSRSS